MGYLLRNGESLYATFRQAKGN